MLCCSFLSHHSGASSPESFPLIFALLFAARACESKVCLLEGYATEKWVSTLTIGKQLYLHLEFTTQVNSAFRVPWLVNYEVIRKYYSPPLRWIIVNYTWSLVRFGGISGEFFQVVLILMRCVRASMTIGRKMNEPVQDSWWTPWSWYRNWFHRKKVQNGMDSMESVWMDMNFHNYPVWRRDKCPRQKKKYRKTFSILRKILIWHVSTA